MKPDRSAPKLKFSFSPLVKKRLLSKPAFQSAKLTVAASDESERCDFSLLANTTVGRHHQCPIQLFSHTVSRQHARIFFNRNHWVLRDLGSTNGTTVNGVAADGDVRLNPGDELCFGDVACIFQQSSPSPDNPLAAAAKPLPKPLHTQFIPVEPTEFLPQTKIDSASTLRLVYEKLRIIYKLQKEIGSAIDIDALLNKILERSYQLLDYDQGVVLLPDRTGALNPLVFRNRDPDAAPVISSTLVSYVEQRRVGIICADVMADERFKKSTDSLILRGVRSSMAVPIMDDQRLLGAIIVESCSRVGGLFGKRSGIDDHHCQPCIPVH
jgi:adenylate cyclase